MIDLLTQEIEGRRAAGKDVSLLLATRAEALLDEIGSLGGSLADCEEVLMSETVNPKARLKSLAVRALIFAFLGVDDFAKHDLDEFETLKKSVEDSDLKMEIRTILDSRIPQGDCPAAFVCNAADWHRARRFAMLRRRPDLRALYDSKEDIYVTCLFMLILVASHFYAGYFASKSLLATLILSWTVGAYCAYGFQALTHELGHMAFHCGGSKNNKLAFVCAALGSSFCNFPWHYYYWNYHNRHHAHAGGERDRDGDILFRGWHAPPTIARNNFFLDLGSSPPLRLLWTGFFGVSIYPMFRRAKSLLDAPHVASLGYEGWNVVAYLLFTFLFGARGLLYLVLSAAFSLGALGHPYIQFWLTQHAFLFPRPCKHEQVQQWADKFNVPLLQPTLSSSTSTWFWHFLNYGELRHVEHHDFPLIPYLKAWWLPEACPEFYSSLVPALSVTEALKDWLGAVGQKHHQWMRSRGDFAGRGYFLGKLWRLMQEMEEGENDSDANTTEEDDEEEETEEQTRQWSPSGDVDDEMAFVQRPTVGINS